MVAYWDTGQKCIFANTAYREWFGKTPEEMVGMSLKDLLGPLYEKNLPHILGALAGQRQVFERRITLPSGEARDTIATYTPDIAAGVVQGFTAHVAEVTTLRQRETVLQETIRDAIAILEKTKHSFHSRDLGVLRKRLEQLSLGPVSEPVTPAARKT